MQNLPTAKNLHSCILLKVCNDKVFQLARELLNIKHGYSNHLFKSKERR